MLTMRCQQKWGRIPAGDIVGQNLSLLAGCGLARR